MAQYSTSSLLKLATVHPDLRRLFLAVLEEEDHAIIWGYRGQGDQEAAKASGHSNASFGESPHNFKPSLAVDAIPSPMKGDWNLPENIARFRKLAEVVKRKAQELGIDVEHGADFKTIKDYPHWQLAGWKQLAKKP